MVLRGTRAASHAGSWYSSKPDRLSAELDKWLDETPSTIAGYDLPVPGARAIIAPHAGYRYSGPCAAWAYRALDLANAKRVFILGPSHTFYLRGCALTTFDKFETPLGDFQVDSAIISELRDTGVFTNIPRHNDVREHSLEMHLPYIRKAVQKVRGIQGPWPTLVPIMVGDNDEAGEKAVGKLLLPYFEDPDNVFVISSDFCHWGQNFDYYHYCPGSDFAEIRELASRRGSRPGPTEPPVHEFIRTLDEAAFAAIETGSQAEFVNYIRQTENTVCGRHPISVAMAALELIAAKSTPSDKRGDKKFTFVRYERSALARTVSDSSVSYGSAFAIL